MRPIKVLKNPKQLFLRKRRPKKPFVKTVRGTCNESSHSIPPALLTPSLGAGRAHQGRPSSRGLKLNCPEQAERAAQAPGRLRAPASAHFPRIFRAFSARFPGARPAPHRGDPPVTPVPRGCPHTAEREGGHPFLAARPPRGSGRREQRGMGAGSTAGPWDPHRPHRAPAPPAPHPHGSRRAVVILRPTGDPAL